MHTSPRLVPDSSTRYREDRRYVLGVLARRCRWLDGAAREDVFHDAYLVLLEKSRSGAIEGEMGLAQIRAYLTRTAINKALDQGKRTSRRRSVSLDHETSDELRSPAPEVAEQVIDREAVRRLDDAMTLLPARRRRVLGLRYYLDLDPGQIQRRLGLSRDVYRHELERGVRAVAAAVAA